MARLERKRLARERRHARVRRTIEGTDVRPRLSVYRSLHHIYAQVIDDKIGHTLVAASTVEPEVRSQIDELDKSAQARLVGKVVGERAVEQGIDSVVFDRGGYKYQGRVKALAEGAREAGLEF